MSGMGVYARGWRLAGIIGLLECSGATSTWAELPHQGVTSADLMRGVGIVGAVIAIFGLIAVEFFFRDRIHRSTYYWLLFVGLLVLPALALTSAGTTVLEETKTVQSCASCHSMTPFVQDMKDPNSPTLAARHYRYRWISDQQCYECHTGYGVHGTLAAKRDGFRHWLLYVTNTYEEPIQFIGTYPNSNCLECHGGAPAFWEIKSHKALAEDLHQDRVNCVTCHGPAHPAPGERPTTK